MGTVSGRVAYTHWGQRLWETRDRGGSRLDGLGCVCREPETQGIGRWGEGTPCKGNWEGMTT